MAKKIIIHELKDWSKIDRQSDFLEGINLSSPELSFGIHPYNGELWTSGYVGVSRVFNKNKKAISTNGKDHILVIKSQYNLDPWEMLKVIFEDDEYEDYIEELNKKNTYLFKIFHEQPLIRLERDEDNSADILLALSFINECYALCKKGIKKEMFHKEENYNAKIRGKVDVKKNIKKNMSHGRNDRFYCKYIEFTPDNIENRILKAALLKCRTIITEKFKASSEIDRRIRYSINTLKSVKNIKIRNKDFNNVSISGLYTYYKPALIQAKSIVDKKYHTYTSAEGKQIKKSMYTVPYMINMENVFEFYARAILKKELKGKNYVVDKYSKKIFLEKNQDKKVPKNIHLMTYCIPDIIIRNNKDEVVAVLDAKYKSHERSSRSDSLQLLSYVLLTGSKRCGFIFPGDMTKIKKLREDDCIIVNTPFNNDTRYYELILSNNPIFSEINKIIE